MIHPRVNYTVAGKAISFSYRKTSFPIGGVSISNWWFSPGTSGSFEGNPWVTHLPGPVEACGPGGPGPSGSGERKKPDLPQQGWMRDGHWTLGCGCVWKWPFIVDMPIKNGDFP